MPVGDLRRSLGTARIADNARGSILIIQQFNHERRRLPTLKATPRHPHTLVCLRKRSQVLRACSSISISSSTPGREGAECYTVLKKACAAPHRVGLVHTGLLVPGMGLLLRLMSALRPSRSAIDVRKGLLSSTASP